MKFYKNFIRTFTDLPGHHSLVIHSLEGCNLNCYCCHNKEELEKPQEVFKTEKDVIEELRLTGFIFDAVIFSGGEFLITDINKIIRFLSMIREIYNGKIIINTNGTFPKKVQELTELNLVNGFHVDMKLPFHSDILKQEDIKRVLGVKLPFKTINNILDTISIVVKQNYYLSQIRTVKYDIVPDEYFKEIEKYISDLNKKYNSNVSYKLNEFIKTP